MDDDSLTFGCQGTYGNDNLHIIKYLIDENGMDCMRKNSDSMTYLEYACMSPGDHNLSKIKYLVEEKSLDPKHVDSMGNNCLIIACGVKGIAIQIIKYLVNDMNIDVNQCDNSGYNCLAMACSWNNDINLVKYLIEEKNMDCSKISDSQKFNEYLNPLVITMTENTDPDPHIINYLIEKNDEMLRDRITHIYFAEYLGPLIGEMHPNKIIIFLKYFEKYYELFNHLLIKISRCNTEETFQKIKSFINTINPLLLNKKVYDIYEIDDPWTSHITDADTKSKFKAFKKYTDELKIIIPLRLDTKQNAKNTVNDSKIKYADYSRLPEELFEYNEKIYYGSKKIVYSSMCIFEDIESNVSDSEQVPILDSITKLKLSQDLINMYIHSCYTKTFDINDVEIDELIPILRFIDQYPMKHLSIDLLEDQLIHLIDNDGNKKLINDQIFLGFAEKYQMKNMYMQIHNLKIM